MALDQPAEVPVASEEAGLSRDVYALLAQANLLRMRGCWEEAVQKCMAALTLAPGHSSAQSLLGDIYENQGRYDDAVQWYHMALDVNPDSPADQLKLNRLLELREQGPPRSRFQQIADRRSPALPHSRRDWFPNPETALRVASLAAALLVLMVVGFAYFTVHRHAALVTLGLASDQEVEAQPVVVPPAANTSAAANVGGVHDAAEQAVLDSLRASAEISAQGITVYDVQADPRSLALSITFGLAPDVNGGVSRDSVLRSALRIAQAAAALPGGQSASVITTRCMETPAAGSSANGSSLIFVGNIAVGALPGDASAAAALTTPQLQALFTNSWWSPANNG